MLQHMQGLMRRSLTPRLSDMLFVLLIWRSPDACSPTDKRDTVCGGSSSYRKTLFSFTVWMARIGA